MQKIESKDQFELLISENKNVLVDFSASWCGPCKVLLPQLEEAEKSQETPGVKFAKIDVDSAEIKDVLERFSIKNVPTVIMFNGGSVKDKFVGAKSKGQILEFIKSSMN